MDATKQVRWDPLTKMYSAEAHDRPSPPLFAPCVSFGFSLRPAEKSDPIESDDPTEQEQRRSAWVKRVNLVLKAFEDQMFRPHGAVPTEQFNLTSGYYSDRDEKKRFRLVSKNFRIRWTNGLPKGSPGRWDLPGYVVIDQQHEYTSFLFTLSLNERDAPRLLPEAENEDPDNVSDAPRLAPLPPASAAPAGSPPAKLLEAIRWLSLREATPDEATMGEIAASEEYALGEIWRLFFADLEQAWRAIGGAGGQVFPGEAFAALKGVVAREDDAWIDGEDPRTPLGQFAAEEAFDALEARRSALSAYFPEGRNREFVGSRTINGQAILVTTLGSTHFDSALEGDGMIVKEGEQVEPTRYFLLLRNRPDAPQLGRMIERLHALETLRIASVIDIDDLRDVDTALRHIGADLDRLIDRRGDRGADKRALEKILGAIADLGGQVRGGLTYRISQASLYAKAYERAMKELREEPIETWQPYATFTRRRLQESFEFIQEVEDRRNFLFQRVQLLLQRNLERETNASLRSTDRISSIAAVVAPTALGVSMGDAVHDLAKAAGVDPAGSGLGPEAFGQVFGFAGGLMIGLVLYLIIRAINKSRR